DNILRRQGLHAAIHSRRPNPSRLAVFLQQQEACVDRILLWSRPDTWNNRAAFYRRIGSNIPELFRPWHRAHHIPSLVQAPLQLLVTGTWLSVPHTSGLHPPRDTSPLSRGQRYR